METAQIFTDKIGNGNIHELSGMAPNDDIKKFAKGLDEDNTMYVGHLPFMGKLVSYLTTRDENAGVVKFTNSGVVCVEKVGENSHIEWFLTPSCVSI